MTREDHASHMASQSPAAAQHTEVVVTALPFNVNVTPLLVTLANEGVQNDFVTSGSHSISSYEIRNLSGAELNIRVRVPDRRRAAKGRRYSRGRVSSLLSHQVPKVRRRSRALLSGCSGRV